MGRVNFARKLEELQRLQQAFKDARKLVERDVGRKVVEMYLQGAGEKEIFQEVRRIVDEVYGYRKFLELRRPVQAQATQEKKRKGVRKNESASEFTTANTARNDADAELLDSDVSGDSGADEGSTW